MVVYGVVAVLMVVVIWAEARRQEPVRVDGRVLIALRAARRRSRASIGLALVLLSAGIATALLVPEWLGIGAALAPAVAGVGGLVLYAATPPPQHDYEPTRYAASLSPRTPWNVAPSAALVALGVAFLLQFVLLVFAGATSSADEQGRFRAITFSSDSNSSTATPYPGWFYTAPLLVATVLLALAIWIALRRVATTASLPGEGLEDRDTMWRLRSAQIIVGLASAVTGLQLGGTALMTGTAISNALLQPGVPIGWQVLATGLTVLGFVSLLLSIVTLTLAALRAFALPTWVARADAEVGRSA
ncbi:hypothetical protein GCG21_04285 [Pseudactinotalea sp. HY160]|uniref:hypothetical protein n=1 Tax=Pseudactinotalea sp. HY160 TaxID=2654490 RepID=UPI00128E3FA1|nr:hypothetical protein [Pseudactinotalea sp. HY160]MPV49233.1 hypothetical protein [Pseudactinotalea sp. HY160]